MPQPPERSLKHPPTGRFYELQGRRIWADRAGAGDPAAVILPGAGAVGLDYFNIQQQAAKRVTSVLYDRGGTGFSDRVRLKRSAAATVEELRTLLGVVGIAPPYVLVGHSLGGLLARRYAQLHPSEVAGLVLLDPAHEDYTAYMPERLRQLRRGWSRRMMGGLSGAMLGFGARAAPGFMERSPAIRGYQELYRPLFAAEMSAWPASLREALVEKHVSVRGLWTGIQEAQHVQKLYREIRAGGPTPDVPMIILNSTATDEFRRATSPGETDAMMAEELAGKRRLYDDLAATVPRGEVRSLDAGHVTMSFRHWEVVVQAINDVVQAQGRPA